MARVEVSYHCMTEAVRIAREYLRGEITREQKTNKIRQLDQFYGVPEVNEAFDIIDRKLNAALDSDVWY